MKNILLVLVCFLTIVHVYSQRVIYSIAYTTPLPVSTFEDRDTSQYFYIDSTQPNNLWQIGTPSKSNLFDSAYSLPLALVTDTQNTYLTNNISSFEFELYSDDATYIKFWHRVNTDTLADGGVIEVSYDGGNTWMNIINESRFTLENFYDSTSIISSSGKPGFSGNSGWIQSTIFGYEIYSVRFRFTFTSDSINTNKDGWMIDDFNFRTYGTGVREIKSNSQFKIYPNPTSDMVSIHSDKPITIKKIFVQNLAGQTILTTTNPDLDMSTFSSGLYLIDITTEKDHFTGKIQKQ